MQLFFSLFVLSWTFLEASFWWVAPDIAISIAYVHQPTYWRRYLLYGFIGACLGGIVTYEWASFSPVTWHQYISTLPMHTPANIDYVRSNLDTPLMVIPGAWSGIPYKLFMGLAVEGNYSFWLVLALGLTSRMIRFSFTLFVTHWIRHFLKPWSVLHPTKLSVVLMLIWIVMILLVDLIINGALLHNGI